MPMGDERAKLWVPRVLLDRAADNGTPEEATSVHIQAVTGPPQKAPYQSPLLRSYNTPDAIKKAQQRFPMGRFFDDMVHLTGSANSARATSKPLSMLSHRALRALSRGSVIDRLIINKRKAQARRFGRVCDVPGKQFGMRVVHRRYQDPEFDSDTDDIRRRCAEIEELLRRPTNPPHHSFGDFLENAIEEELVLDRRFVVLPQGRSNKPISYHLIDGATVYPRMEVLADWMIAHNVGGDTDRALALMQQELWSNPPRDKRTGEAVWVDLADAEYVQMVDDRVVGAWKSGEYHMAIAHGSVAFDAWGYGYSALEDSYQTSLLFMQALRYNKNLFDVNYPEAILTVAGNVDEEGLKAFRRNVLDYDPSEASTRLPIIPGGDELQANLLRLRDTPRDMLMSEMLTLLANMKCAAYGMHPSEINVTPDGQGGAVVSMDNSEGDEIAQATEEGFHSLMYGQCDLVTESLIRPHYTDLIAIPEGMDRENEQSLLARLQFTSQFSTFNEVRAELSKKPLPSGLPVEIGDFVGGQAWMGAYQAIMGQQQQQQQGDMGQYEQGDFGQPQGGSPQQPWQGQPGGAPGAPGGLPPGAPGGAPGGLPPGGGQPGPGGGNPVQQGWQQTQAAQAGGGFGKSLGETITIRIDPDGDFGWPEPWEEA